jgi:beta-galactosidase
VLLGSGRYFVDEKGDLWQPDQLYRKGAWGSVDGKKFKLENNNRLPYGTDKNIIGTNDDPVYQTQQTGIHQYRLDVPAGRYELTLHFAELLGGKVRVPPYNLNVEERDEKGAEKNFQCAGKWQNRIGPFQYFGSGWNVKAGGEINNRGCHK